jgi:outer membrane protein assembly factor BamB
MMYREDENPQPVLLVGINGVVVGLNPEDGTILWKNELPGGGYGFVSMELFDGIAVVSSMSEKVFCIDCKTGVTRWEAKASHSSSTDKGDNIYFKGGRVFVSKMGYIDCFSLEDGTKLWTQPLTGLGTGATTLRLQI